VILDLALPDALHQASDLQRVRTKAAQRRERAVQHVVAAFELARGFHARDAVRLFHHAHNGGVAARVGTVTAKLAVADVVAHAAEAQLVNRRTNAQDHFDGLVRF
jgi:hypothetical protein